MAKQSVQQRIGRVWSDYQADKNPDVRKRWAKIKEDLPEAAEAVIAKYGDIPVATLDDVPLQEAITYACRDADATLRVDSILDGMLDSMDLRGVYEMDLAVVPMVDRMQSVGMLVDPEYFAGLADYLTELMGLKIQEICRAVPGTPPDFNPNSGDQVEEWLTKRLHMRLSKKTKSGLRYSTNDKILEGLVFKNPLVRHVTDYREFVKLRDSYAVALPKFAGPDGRVHPNFRVTRVSSGRLSCTDPNLLGIPVRTELGKLVRGGFNAGPGRVMGSWDLDQIEVREMAHQSRDPVLMGWINQGLDTHRQVASEAFGKKPEDVSSLERYAGKRLNFGVITGITEIGLAEQMALAGAEGWDEQRCGDFIKEYFNILRGVRAYLESCRAEARRYSYVRDRWGRIRYLPGVHSELPFVRAEAERQSHSFKISASAQGTLKRAMAAIWDWWKSENILGRVEPLLQIHDELVVEADDDKDFLDYLDQGMVWFLCNAAPMAVPIKAKGSIGETWGDLKD